MRSRLDYGDMVATPVDYKRGKAPQVPEGAYEPECVQLCAQGLILRANGFQCERGVLYFIGSKKRVTIEFTDELIQRTRQLRDDFRHTAAAGVIPVPLVDSPKCPRCSLVGICLPDETNLLRDAAGLQCSVFRFRTESSTTSDSPLIGDSVTLMAFNNGEVDHCSFLERAGAVTLTEAGRKAIIAAFERRLEQEVTHPVFGYRVSYRRILEVQARLLARAVTGELPEYVPFCTR